jgi:hypothetical protein
MQADTIINFQEFVQNPQVAFAAFRTLLMEREILHSTCETLTSQIKEKEQLLGRYEDQAKTILDLTKSLAQLELMILGSEHEKRIAPIPGQLH